MHWIVADLLMFGSSVVLYLLIRKSALAGQPVQYNNLAMFGVPAIIFSAASAATRPSLHLSWPLAALMLFTGVVLSYASSAASLKSLALAPNPGYSLVISKSSVVLVTFLAVPLLGDELKRQAIAAVLCIVASSALILVNPHKGEHARSQAWLPLALAAFVGWAFLALAAKFFNMHGLGPLGFLTYLFVIVAGCIGLEMRTKRISLRVIRARWRLFVAIGLASATWNWFLFYAISIAPNVGYVSATNAASIGAVTVLASVIFKDEFSWRKLAGVAGVIGGLGLLFLQ
jgi:drug/metabolite transporter (DMT)-like permease